MNSEEVLKIIQVHPRLIEEFNIMKIDLEKATGYPIRGGNPIVSLIVADILKKRRENKFADKKENVKIEIVKVKGCKKNDVFFL
jgi:hypothetical protein